MSVTTGLQLPFGIQPVNPVPVDAWSGPFVGAVDNVQSAIDAANASIPSAIRFQSMEVRLIVNGTSRKFWYRDGTADADLVEFSTTTSGSFAAAGPESAVQFNDGGILSGSSSFTFNKNTSSLTVSSLSGSLTTLSDGSSYLVAGDNVTITTGSNGQITISSAGSSGASPLSIPNVSWMESPTGDIDGMNMIFDLSQTPSPTNSLMFFVNGVLQKQNSDYYLDNNSVTLWMAPNEGSNLSATYTYQVPIGLGQNTSWAEVPIGDVDGVNVVYSISHTPYPLTALMFYVNGVLQIQGENYDFLVSDNLVILKAAPHVGSNLLATYPY
jgi:hypothetical protein